MARLVYGPLVTAVKGSIAGITFQNNASGAIVRSRPRPTRVSSVKQTASHVQLSQLLYEWQQISQDERDLWNDYAAAWVKVNKFGESKTLTGANWFSSCNWWRLYFDLAILSAPPAHDLPQAPPSFAPIMSSSQLLLNFLEAHDYVTYPVIVWASTPTKKNTLSINQVRKLITVIEATPADPLDITTAWETATGLDWDPSVNFPSANIFICLESITKSSCITSAMLCTKNNTPSAEGDEIYYYI